MTESQYTAKLIKLLRKRMPDAIIWKVSDRFNAGRPDVQVIVNGKTTYIECKKYPHKPTKIQQYYLDKIALSSYWVQFGKAEHMLNWHSGCVPCGSMDSLAWYIAAWCEENE